MKSSSSKAFILGMHFLAFFEMPAVEFTEHLDKHKNT